MCRAVCRILDLALFEIQVWILRPQRHRCSKTRPSNVSDCFVSFRSVERLAVFRIFHIGGIVDDLMGFDTASLSRRQVAHRIMVVVGSNEIWQFYSGFIVSEMSVTGEESSCGFAKRYT